MVLKRCYALSATALLLVFTLGGQAQDFTRFPQHFKWCVATSAHQIEGNNFYSDWWAWEKLAGKIKNGERSKKATDHWNRVAEDISLLQSLGVQQYRMSIEWAKVEPFDGDWSEDAIAHYKKEISDLYAAGIEPILTLQHFTLPIWVAANGGFEWSDFERRFGLFVKKVTKEIAPQVRTWVTFNEPLVVLLGSYVDGAFPPGEKRPLNGIRLPLVGLLKGHALAYRIIKENIPSARVGMAHHLRVFKAANSLNPLDYGAAQQLDYASNWAIPNSLETGQLEIAIPFVVKISENIPGLQGTQDFFGMNYYTRDHVSLSLGSEVPIKRFVKPGLPVSDMGWEIYPKGIYLLLKEVSRKFKDKPILITENGIADSLDRKRKDFIKDHLRYVERAIREGAPVENYCHWSFLDNFEWAEGFTPRFGLFEVNYSTFERTPRLSAIWFSDLTRQNGFY